MPVRGTCGVGCVIGALFHSADNRTCAVYARTRAFDFLPVLKRGDSYAVCLDGSARFGGFPFRGQVRFIGCRQCSSHLVSTGV